MAVRITFERARLLFSYDEENGTLIWNRRGPDTFPGKTAGVYSPVINSVVITIDGKSYRAHRVIWLWNTGHWPANEIDHISGDGANNRMDNLREVSCSENHKNMPVPRNSKSGIIGVRYHNGSGAWIAQIKVNGCMVHLGSFDSKGAATDARKTAEKAYGFHLNHGRPSGIDGRKLSA